MKNQITILWLDDKRDPEKYFAKKCESGAFIRNKTFYDNNVFNQFEPHFIWVRNIREFMEYIHNNEMPDLISFDHDLTVDKNNPEPDGREVAKWLVKYCKETGMELPKCFVHSANQSKTPEMNGILGVKEGKTVIRKTINEEQLAGIVKECVSRILKGIINESSIQIDKKNEGKFTETKKKTGKTTEELTHSKNPLTRKRAIFAQNAKKWNHKKNK